MWWRARFLCEEAADYVRRFTGKLYPATVRPWRGGVWTASADRAAGCDRRGRGHPGVRRWGGFRSEFRLSCGLCGNHCGPTGAVLVGSTTGVAERRSRAHAVRRPVDAENLTQRAPSPLGIRLDRVGVAVRATGIFRPPRRWPSRAVLRHCPRGQLGGAWPCTECGCVGAQQLHPRLRSRQGSRASPDCRSPRPR